MSEFSFDFDDEINRLFSGITNGFMAQGDSDEENDDNVHRIDQRHFTIFLNDGNTEDIYCNAVITSHNALLAIMGGSIIAIYNLSNIIKVVERCPDCGGLLTDENHVVKFVPNDGKDE